MEPKSTINLILGIIGLISFGLVALILLILKEFGLVIFLIIVEVILGLFVYNTRKQQTS